MNTDFIHKATLQDYSRETTFWVRCVHPLGGSGQCQHGYCLMMAGKRRADMRSPESDNQGDVLLSMEKRFTHLKGEVSFLRNKLAEVQDKKKGGDDYEPF